MIKAIIIDDEQNNIDNLQILLQQFCPQVTVIGTALNVDDGEKKILQHNPDILFLDIQMPNKNGFDLLKSLHNYLFEIIFVTAYDQYGVSAVKFAALDYLLKPINIDELKLAVQKASQKSLLKQQNEQLKNLMYLLEKKGNKNLHRIALQTLKEIRFIEPDSLIRCESANNYSTFFLESGEKILVSKPIYEYEELLSDYGFIRCHQSHLVNIKFIKSWIKEDGGYLLLDNKVQIPVSKQKRELVKKRLA